MSTATISAAPPPARLRRGTVAATVVGNFVELFDWYAFGLFAPLLAPRFFPSHDAVGALLGTFGIFAAGMLFRPLGGVLLGRFADRRGRKPAMLLTLALMGSGSLVVAAAPTYAQVGVVAPLVLLAGRLAQGLSGGGEWPSAVTYLMELAPRRRTCLYGSFFGVSAAAGALVVGLLGGSISAILSPEQLATWGWRVPFAVGGVLTLGLLAVRSRLAESAVFEQQVRDDDERGSLRTVLTRHRRSVLLVVAFAAGTTMLSGTWTTVVPAMGQEAASPGEMFWVVTVATGIAVLLQVPLGALADRTGIRPFLVVYGLGAAVVGPIAYLTIDAGFARLLFSYGTGVMLMTVLTAVMPSVLARAYPASVRTLGIGLPHGTTTAIFGGLSPWLATFLAGRGASGVYIGIVAVTSVIAVVAGLTILRTPAETAEAVGGVRDDEPALAAAA